MEVLQPERGSLLVLKENKTETACQLMVSTNEDEVFYYVYQYEASDCFIWRTARFMKWDTKKIDKAYRLAGVRKMRKERWLYDQYVSSRWHCTSYLKDPSKATIHCRQPTRMAFVVFYRQQKRFCPDAGGSGTANNAMNRTAMSCTEEAMSFYKHYTAFSSFQHL